MCVSVIISFNIEICFISFVNIEIFMTISKNIECTECIAMGQHVGISSITHSMSAANYSSHLTKMNESWK